MDAVALVGIALRAAAPTSPECIPRKFSAGREMARSNRSGGLRVADAQFLASVATVISGDAAMAASSASVRARTWSEYPFIVMFPWGSRMLAISACSLAMGFGAPVAVVTGVQGTVRPEDRHIEPVGTTHAVNQLPAATLVPWPVAEQP